MLNKQTTKNARAYYDEILKRVQDDVGCDEMLRKTEKQKTLPFPFSFSHFTSFCPAFSLAEVLITLGIIGIVAAITIPIIIEKVQKNTLKTQIRNSYSMYSQALAKTKLDLGYDISGLPQNEWGDFSNTLISNLKVVKVCNGNALAGGCLPKYVDYVCSDGCPAYKQNSIENTKTVYVLADGSTFLMYAGGWLPKYWIDINGQKGPNKSGYDIFELELNSKRNMLLFISGCVTLAPGGLSDYVNLDKW